MNVCERKDKQKKTKEKTLLECSLLRLILVIFRAQGGGARSVLKVLKGVVRKDQLAWSVLILIQADSREVKRDRQIERDKRDHN